MPLKDAAEERKREAKRKQLEHLWEIGEKYSGEKNYTQAVFWCQKAAEQGDTGTQYNLGWCLENGEGTAIDKAKALDWYRQAADQGYEDAQKKLKELTGNV